MEALENADIFYEMQYKEVKIVTNVSHVVCLLGANLESLCLVQGISEFKIHFYSII